MHYVHCAARYCYSKSSVCLSLCLSVTLMYRGHISLVSAKVITRLISLGSSLLGASINTGNPVMLCHKTHKGGYCICLSVCPEISRGVSNYYFDHVTMDTPISGVAQKYFLRDVSLFQIWWRSVQAGLTILAIGLSPDWRTPDGRTDGHAKVNLYSVQCYSLGGDNKV